VSGDGFRHDSPRSVDETMLPLPPPQTTPPADVGEDDGLRKITEVVWLDGLIVHRRVADPSVASSTFHMGTGVFDGLMAYWNTDHWHLHAVAQHFERFRHGCEHMELDFSWSSDELEAGVRSLLQGSRHKTMYIRPIAYRGAPELLLVTSQHVPVNVCIFGIEVPRDVDAPISCEISSIERVSSRAIPVAWKISGTYANSFLAQVRANRNGFDTALLLDRRGYISEAATSNVLFIRGDEVVTPSLDADVFPGITRAYLLPMCRELGINVVERSVSPCELPQFEAALLCSTLMELRAVSRIGDQILESESHPVFLSLRDSFRALTHEVLESKPHSRKGFPAAGLMA
jgi:branched-chain amino acid aminotransferase